MNYEISHNCTSLCECYLKDCFKSQEWRKSLIAPPFMYHFSLGTLRKTRLQRQRERHETKGLMSKTIAVHVRYNSWYISLPFSGKQQREMTKFYVA